MPALSEAGLSGQKRLRLPKVGAGPYEAARRAAESGFLDAKRGFLTAFAETLSVLFGEGIRSSGDRILSCSGTPFSPVRRESALFYPLEPSDPARIWPDSGQKVANMQPFCHFSGRKTYFWSPFGHLLSGKFDSGGPTHWFEEVQLAAPTSLSLLFSGKGACRIPH